VSYLNPLAIPGDPEEVENPNALLALDESGYIAPDVETDQAAIAEQVFNDLASRVSGWQAHDGNLEVWLTEAWAEVSAEVRALARDVPASVFLTYGSDVLGIPPDQALAATGLATFTASDSQGYTLEVGAQFALARSGDDLVAFSVDQETTIPPGETQVWDVPFTAVQTGSEANGLSGEGQMLDPVRWVSDVSVDIPTDQGFDAESAADYLDRLSILMRMVALRPVLPVDFAILALQVRGVSRAVAMNMYDPVTATWTNARMVTVMLTDVTGQPCPDAVKLTVADMLEGLREVNWVCPIIDATYDTVDVAYDVVAFAGQQMSTVQEACDSAVTAYLNPMNYRLNEDSPAIAGGEVVYPPDAQATRNQYIYVNEIIALLDRTLGVDRVVSVTLNGAAADYLLPDPYSLPEPGVITGTVEGGAA
jgi:hypothetical protein